MREPEIRLWPFRGLDPIPNPLPDDLDELSKNLSPVWIKTARKGKPDPRARELVQYVIAARALCDTYPGAEFLGEIAGTGPRNRHQDERRYPLAGRGDLVDVVMAETELARLSALKVDQAREWAGVLHLLYADRFPELWSGGDRPDLILPLSAAILIAELADGGNIAAQCLVAEVARNAADYVTSARSWVSTDKNDPILVVIGSLARKSRTWQQKFIGYLGGESDAKPATPPAAASDGTCLASN